MTLSNDPTSTPQDVLVLEQSVAAAHAIAPQPETRTGQILVSSQTPGMAEMVCRALSQDHAVEVQQAKLSVSDLNTDETHAISEYDIVVLDIKPGDDDALAALRSLRARAPETTRFLAMTADALTLAFARQLMDAGVDEVLPLMDVRPELRHAQPLDTEGMGAAQQVAQPAHNGMVISIAQTRGGVGATALALNLATLLSAPANRKQTAPAAKVALLDLDFQNGDAAASVDIEDNGAFIELLKIKGDMNAAFLNSALVAYKDRFDVLPTPVEFAPLDAMSVEMVSDMITALRGLYDYVIIGMPRAMAHWIEPVVARTDQMLLISDGSVTGMRQARRLIDFFTEDNPGLPLEMVMANQKKPSSLPKSLKEATKFLDKPLDIWVPRDDRTARKATDQGVPMAELSQRGPVVKALKPLIAQIQTIQASARRRDA
ncbi:MAG: CpaE family protein [Roseovarius sp.]